MASPTRELVCIMLFWGSRKKVFVRQNRMFFSVMLFLETKNAAFFWKIGQKMGRRSWESNPWIWNENSSMYNLTGRYFGIKLKCHDSRIIRNRLFKSGQVVVENGHMIDGRTWRARNAFFICIRAKTFKKPKLYLSKLTWQWQAPSFFDPWTWSDKRGGICKWEGKKGFWKVTETVGRVEPSSKFRSERFGCYWEWVCG